MRRAAVTPLLLGLIVAAAAALRLAHLAQVPGNPFYDAAVHTMATSWHAFLFGALDPSGGVSVDKPPVDLWLQVAAVKVFGFHAAALKLPQALAGVASVVVLFDLGRRAFGSGAGLAAAAALAVLPVAVLTARSDTMDTAMGLFVLLAVWLIVRALETRQLAWLLAAGVAVGLAFNVKLFQALLPLPALALLWFAGSRLGPRRTLAGAAAASLVALVVAFAWIAPVALTPAHDRPYPIGSTNGSVWNLVFVFNGVDRLHGRPVTTPDTLPPGSKLSAAIVRTQLSRTRHAATSGPGLLFGPRFTAQIGSELFPALAVLAAGAVLAAVALRRRRLRGGVAVALALAMAAWLLTGTLIFSAMGRFHPRYFEAISPAVAAVLGGGLVLLIVRGSRTGRAFAAAVAIATGLYVTAHAAIIGGSARWELLACLGAAAVLIALASQDGPRRGAVAAAATLALAAVLIVPAATSWSLVRANASDAEHSGSMPENWPPLINRYLARHRGGARYSFASIAPAKAAPLIAAKPQPVLMLTSYRSRPLVGLPRLERLVRAGDVRYFLLGHRCTSALTRATAACPATAHWAIAHSTDVSRATGIDHGHLVYRINFCPVPGQARGRGRSARQSAPPRSARRASRRSRATCVQRLRA
jgi:4-amino-4-deoxy-L-arabinose transferase-like glycosyltransferase